MEDWVEAMQNSFARLEEGYARYLRDISDAQVRDGLIQRFEFTYDLTHKTLRRALARDSGTAEAIDQLTFPSLIREGFAKGYLTEGWPAWHNFREMRNLTSHSYNEATAIKVVSQIPRFIEECRRYVKRLVDGPKG